MQKTAVCCWSAKLWRRNITKTLIVMQLTGILLFTLSLHVAANTVGQTVTLSGKHLSVKHVFEAVKRQTNYDIFYNKDVLKGARPISIDAQNMKVVDFLSIALKDQPFEFYIENQNIIITRKSLATNLSRKIPFLPPPIDVNGKITDAEGKPLVGASIKLIGTNKGAVADANGNFTIQVPDEKGVLAISFIGYQTVEIPVTKAEYLNIVLKQEGNKMENEVIVIGYGTQRKSDLTGAVGSVKGEKLQERPATSVAQVLAGRLAGVNVSVNSGRPGGKPNIRIRGNTSISITNDPLYIVDGVITSIDFLDPNDVASIEVLKDASSTSIYGARGSNGVVLVTTKRGSKGGGQVSYNTEQSMGELSRKIDVLNAKEFLMVEDIAYQNAHKYDSAGWAAGKYEDPKLKRNNPLLFDADGNPLYDTDWQKEATRKAYSQNHNLALTGGDAKNSYGVYLGYRNEEGIIKSSYLKRFSGRFVFDSEIKPWLKVGGSLSYYDQTESQIDQGGASIEVLREVIEQLPIIPVKFPDGSWASNLNYPNVESAPNPIQIIDEQDIIVKAQTVLGNVYANISLAKGLEFRTTIGADIRNQQFNSYSGRNLNFIALNQGGIASVSHARNNFWQLENYLSYNKRISDDHSFSGMLGASWQHSDNYGFGTTTWTFQDDFFQTNNLGIGANPQPPSSSASAVGLNSYFGRINYNLREKYLFTVSGRTDGSSRFGAAERYAFFPSAAVGWRISEENFIKNIPVISNLKLRASYGSTGNSEIGAYQALAGLGSYSVIFNETRTSGTGVGRLPNSRLKWEKTNQADVGLEIGLFNNRVSLEVDLYHKLTTNMLLNTPIPTTSGFSTVAKNIGSMSNRGIEVSLNMENISTRTFSWNTTFNISVNKNRVEELVQENADIFPGPTYVSETNVARVGQPMGSFFGYVRLGTWGTHEKGQSNAYNREPGDLKFQDTNNDGNIDALDRVIIGKGIPDGFGSLINTFKYKNFDLIIDLQFMYGNDVLVLSKAVQEFRTGLANSRATVLNAWTPDNQNTPVQQIRPTQAGYDLLQDSRMVEDGSFIRGRNFLLAYNFSPELLKKIHLNRLKVTASVQNLFLITDYTGYDPEVSTRNETYGQGIINFDYPKPRVFMLGLYVGF